VTERFKNSRYLGVFIVSLGAIFYFYEYFLRIAPSVMKEQWFTEFNIDATGFGQLSQYYFLAYTPMQAVVGVMIDRFNLRNIMVFAVICCSVGSFMMAVSHDLTIVSIGRFLQGFGSAFGFVGALKLAAIWLPLERFAFFSGLCCMGGFFGAAFGIVGLNYLVELVGWRESIELFTIMGVFIAIAFVIFLGIKPHKIHCASLHKEVTLIEMLCQFGNIMKQPNLWIAGLISFLMFLPTSVFAALWGQTYISELHPDFTTTQAGLTSAMIFIGWGLGAPVQGYLSDRFNNRIGLIIFGAAFSTLFALIAMYVASLNFIVLCITFILFGMASSVQVLTFAMARDLCTASLAGTAIAFVNTLAMLGGMIFQGGVGYLLDLSRGGRVDELGAPLYLIADYQKAFLIIPVALALAFLLGLVGIRGERAIKAKQKVA